MVSRFLANRNVLGYLGYGQCHVLWAKAQFEPTFSALEETRILDRLEGIYRNADCRSPEKFDNEPIEREIITINICIA